MGIVYLAYNSGTPVSSGSNIPMNTVIRRKCSNVGTDMILKAPGYYLVSVDADLTAGTTAGDVSISLKQNDVLVQGATAVETVAANGSTHLSFSAVVRNNYCSNVSVLTLVYDGVALTSTNATVVIQNA